MVAGVSDCMGNWKDSSRLALSTQLSPYTLDVLLSYESTSVSTALLPLLEDISEVLHSQLHFLFLINSLNSIPD